MKPKKISGTYAVYLLHFDAPIGGKQHYVGICQAQRLHWRMLEHSRGKASRLTKAANELGIGFTIANTWMTDDPAYERIIKKGSHFAKRCPICKNPNQVQQGEFEGLHYAPRPPVDHAATVAWPQSETLPF